MKPLPHFSWAELACPTTQECRLAPGFGEQLESLRLAYGKPMHVTSACRSQAHLEHLLRQGYPASRNSFHLMDNPKYDTGGCCAVDIALTDAKERGILLHLALGWGWTVGVAKTYLHLDRRIDHTTLPQIVYVY